MRRGRRKMRYGTILLALTLVSVTCASVGTAIPDHAMHPNQLTTPWGSSWIVVYAQEKYGPKDNPDYRPLGNVTLMLWGCAFFFWPVQLLSFLKWRHDGEVPSSGSHGPTTDEGYFVIPHVYLGNYRLFAHKDGYVDLHYKWGVFVAMDGTPGSATCMLTAKGSPWDPGSYP
jgi:hypothetical protein